MKRRVSILLTLAVFACTGALAAGFSADTAAINEAVRSVVMLEIYGDDGTLESTGSGFCAFDSHTIVTNYHVAEGARRIVAHLDQGGSFTVTRILAWDRDRDIAILRTDAGDELVPLPLHTGEAVRGAPVVAIGCPKGLRNTVSLGNVSADFTEGGVHYIQFTAPISSGSSGGALFNDSGEVIGITSSCYDDGRGIVQNLNFAVAADHVEDLYRTAEGVEPVALRAWEGGPFFGTAPDNRDGSISGWFGTRGTPAPARTEAPAATPAPPADDGTIASWLDRFGTAAPDRTEAPASTPAPRADDGSIAGWFGARGTTAPGGAAAPASTPAPEGDYGSIAGWFDARATGTPAPEDRDDGSISGWFGARAAGTPAPEERDAIGSISGSSGQRPTATPKAAPTGLDPAWNAMYDALVSGSGTTGPALGDPFVTDRDSAADLGVNAVIALFYPESPGVVLYGVDAAGTGVMVLWQCDSADDVTDAFTGLCQAWDAWDSLTDSRMMISIELPSGDYLDVESAEDADGYIRGRLERTWVIDRINGDGFESTQRLIDEGKAAGVDCTMTLEGGMVRLVVGTALQSTMTYTVSGGKMHSTGSVLTPVFSRDRLTLFEGDQSIELHAAD